MEGVRELRRCVTELGFKGLRMIPWLWEAPPTDRRYYPLYAACVELGVPFCTQVGHTGPLRPSETGRPIPYIDQVAIDFPELVIVCGHIGYPWTEEMVAVARKHEHVYIDTSAYTARRYPPELVAYLRTRGGSRKVMFGSNHPMIAPAQALEHLNRLKIDDETQAAVPARQRRAGVRPVSANRIALLRGINIGPRQRVKMPELRELMEGLGHTNVETLVQSGNVVFTSRAAPKTLEKQLETEIQKGLGVDPKVVVRTRDELAAVIEANPFPDVDNPKKNLHVTFFSGEPDAEARKTLESTDFGDDRLAFKGREVYIAYKDGMGRSELAKQLTKGEARRRRHRPQLEHGHNAAGDVRRVEAWTAHAATTPPTAPNKWPCHEMPGVGTSPNISVEP